MQWDPLAPRSVTTEWPINQVACSVNKLTGTVFLGVCRCFVNVFHAFVRTTAGVAFSLRSSCRGVDIVIFVVCARSAMLQGRRAWEEEGVVFQPGYFSSSLVSASCASFSVTLTIVPLLEPHVSVTKRQHATLPDCGARTLSHCVFLTVCLTLLSSWLTFISVSSLTNCMVPTMRPAAVLINMTSACFVRLWPDQVQH